jgi:hypothetical protein
MDRLPGITITDVLIDRITRMFESSCHDRVYPYAWDGLEDDLQARNESHFVLMGYGSLINTRSAAVTLNKSTLASRRPGICFGARRLFNNEMPTTTGRYSQSEDDQVRAGLMAYYTGMASDVMNGVLMDVNMSEIPALRQREIGYDLHPVVAMEWGEEHETLTVAYILCTSGMLDKRVDSRR